MSKHLPKINCLKAWIPQFPKWQNKRFKRENQETDKTKNSRNDSIATKN